MRRCWACDCLWTDNVTECPRCEAKTEQIIMRDEPDSVVHDSLRSFGVATRNPLGNKIQYFGPDGLISIPALRAYGRYMRTHRKQEGTDKLRDFSNWRQGDGIPQDVCIDSLGRHMLDLAELLEGADVVDESTGCEVSITDACCAIIFNAFSILDSEVRHNA